MPFNSSEFRSFAAEWDFKLTTSSPTYAQSNGQAERAVQTVKNIFKKSTLGGTDPYIALLEYRNTPITGTDFSPAQMLMSRMLRGKLPTSVNLVMPKVVKPRSQLVDSISSESGHGGKRPRS